MNMKRIKTIETRDLRQSKANGGCGECQTSCQSACKTSCGVSNQQCEKSARDNFAGEKK
jgi:predicted ribosomally synthesized six-cysteine peptide SCIFF